MARRGRGDDGDVAPLVVLTGLTVVLVMLVVQLGLFFHARTIVNAAAQDGLRAAQLEGAGPGTAQRAARQVLVGSDRLLPQPVVIVRETSNEIEVVVAAEVVSLVPFWQGEVRSQVVGPVEKFRPQGDR